MPDLLSAFATPSGPICILTGAGVSVASGIPTFRGSDPGAVWAKDVMEMGTRRFFMRDPVASWSWYLGRFDAVWRAGPNAAHFAVKALQDLTGATLVTQNIDGLHLLAGSVDAIQVHGSARQVRCSREGCVAGSPRGTLPWPAQAFAAFREDPRRETLPTCPHCGAFVRAHVLWFDEYYNEHEGYGFDRFVAVLPTVRCMVFVGTSFAVGITEMALQHCVASGCVGFVVDPHLAQLPHPSLIGVREASETVLPRLVEALSGARSAWERS
jgi:NAD-dependent deacetylase